MFRLASVSPTLTSRSGLMRRHSLQEDEVRQSFTLGLARRHSMVPPPAAGFHQLEVTMATDRAVRVGRWKAILAITGVIALTSGCAATTATPSSVVAATATASATAEATSLPPAKALCASGGGGSPVVTCQLAAGTYSAAPFVPIFRFTVGAGWENDLVGSNAGQLS